MNYLRTQSGWPPLLQPSKETNHDIPMTLNLKVRGEKKKREGKDIRQRRVDGRRKNLNEKDQEMGGQPTERGKTIISGFYFLLEGKRERTTKYFLRFERMTVETERQTASRINLEETWSRTPVFFLKISVV